MAVLWDMGAGPTPPPIIRSRNLPFYLLLVKEMIYIPQQNKGMHIGVGCISNVSEEILTFKQVVPNQSIMRLQGKKFHNKYLLLLVVTDVLSQRHALNHREFLPKGS